MGTKAMGIFAEVNWVTILYNEILLSEMHHEYNIHNLSISYY